MPFHIFLSQWLSTYTGGLNEWKLAKDVITAILVIFTPILVWLQRRGTRLFNWLVLFAAVYALLHLLLWAVHLDIYKQSALLGIIYNNRVVWYLLIGFGARLLYPEGFAWQRIVKIVLIISTIVAALGALQYFLPKDILTHFGYSTARGVKPNFFIDDNPEFPRVMSTIRDPNTLGAYLLLPVALITGLTAKVKSWRHRIELAALWLLHILAIVLTFARSAWLATALVVILVIWWNYHAWLGRMFKRWWPIVAILVVMAGVGAYATKNTSFVKGVIVHSTGKPKAAHDSDGFHLLFVENGLKGIAHDPFGYGPGTAGLASIQNPKGSFLTENYYVQIGYEVGVVGLALFVLLNIVVYRQLLQRNDNQLTVALLATFWGYILVNMLLHIWSNEAVAAQWWILAGLAIAVPKVTTKPKSKRAA
jgi:hypothetical protein